MSSRFSMLSGATQLFSCRAVRRRAQPGLAGTYGARRWLPARTTGARQARRRGATTPPSATSRGALRWRRWSASWSSIRCSKIAGAGRLFTSPCCSAPTSFRLVGRRRAGAGEYARSMPPSSPGTSWASTSSWRVLRQWPAAARAAAECGIAREDDILAFARWSRRVRSARPVGRQRLERGRNGGSGIRLRSPCRRAARPAGQGSGIVLGAGNSLSQDAGEASAARTLRRRGTRTW